MPNRILRESILTSERVDDLDAEGERFYRRLMSVVDDYACFDGRPQVIRAACFSLKLATITDDQIVWWMAACVCAGLIHFYQIDGKPYVKIYNLGEPRAKRSKWPQPLVNKQPARTCEHMKTYENICTALRLAPCAIRLSNGGKISAAPTADAGLVEPKPIKDPKPPKEKKERKPDTGPFAEVRQHFTDLWERAHGGKYPFMALDGIKIAELFDKCGQDVTKAKGVLTRYVACREPFYDGHPLVKLVSAGGLAKFMANGHVAPTLFTRQPHRAEI